MLRAEPYLANDPALLEERKQCRPVRERFNATNLAETARGLATGVIVLTGVSIGVDTVIGAGSVVTKDMPAGHLCYGNPCRVIREIRN